MLVTCLRHISFHACFNKDEYYRYCIAVVIFVSVVCATVIIVVEGECSLKSILLIIYSYFLSIFIYNTYDWYVYASTQLHKHIHGHILYYTQGATSRGVKQG